MKSLSSLTKFIQRCGQRSADRCYLRPGKSVILTKFSRPSRIVQIENSLTAAADDMDMRGPMVVEIDRDAQPGRI